MTTVIAGVYKQAGLPDEIVPVKVASDGTLVGGSGGGGGGTSDTTEATQLQVKTAVQNIDTDIGSPADAAATTDTGTFSVIALIKRGLQNWTTLLSRIPSLVSGRVPVDGSGVTQPVVAVGRTSTGCQQLSISNTSVALSPPANSVACNIQADGNTIRITQNGAAASATLGLRLDDGVMYYVDTDLTQVRLFAPVACSVIVTYFDKV